MMARANHGSNRISGYVDYGMSRTNSRQPARRVALRTLGVMVAFVVLTAAVAPEAFAFITPTSASDPHPSRVGTVAPGDAVAATMTVVRHITLDASAPEDDSAVEGEVNEVRLFFSEPPLMRGASIRIVDSSRKLVRSTPPEADAEDPSQLSVQISDGLPAGRYVVQWRCIADDGHVMRGSFTFDVVGR